MRKLILTAGCLLGALVAAPTIQATPIIYQITGDHATGGLGTPPFGTVTLNQNGANVDFTVSLKSGYSFVTTGAADDQYFKFNGTGVALADIMVTDSTLKANTGTFNGDGTGSFTFGIGPNPLNNGNNPRSTGISFSVDNATIADVTQPNGDGILFVADLLAPNGNTGPAYVSAPPVGVPDGGITLVLLGSALSGIALLRRKLS